MSKIRLIKVVSSLIPTIDFLYDLLLEREPYQNISHNRMPSFDQHRTFVELNPYKYWYLIYANDVPVGSIYLSKQNEIGIFIKKEHWGNGYGKLAVCYLMNEHPQEQFLANINPNNSKSTDMFETLGFELLQLTYVKRQKC
jgi:RimJ/RimL family protein N-acetyltransferase